MSPTSGAAGLVPAPAPLAAELRPWVDALRDAAGPACRAIYLHGSALTPRFDPATSNVNLLVIVVDMPQSRLDTLARAVAAQRVGSSRRVTPLVLTEEQTNRSVDVFPLEFHDLALRRALLDGTDVLASLRVGHGPLRHQCESELRAKLVGLRQAYLLGGGTSELASQLLVRAAGGSAAVYRGLLELRGAARVEEGDVLASAVATAFGVDASGLSVPFKAHREPPVGDAATV